MVTNCGVLIVNQRLTEEKEEDNVVSPSNIAHLTWFA